MAIELMDVLALCDSGCLESGEVSCLSLLLVGQKECIAFSTVLYETRDFVDNALCYMHIPASDPKLACEITKRTLGLGSYQLSQDHSFTSLAGWFGHSRPILFTPSPNLLPLLGQLEGDRMLIVRFLGRVITLSPSKE